MFRRTCNVVINFSCEEHCLGFLELILGSGDLGWCWGSWSGGNSRITGLVVARLATLEWEP